MNVCDKLQMKGIPLYYKDIVLLCQKYRINEFSIFGSSLRDDFTDASDIDILVSFDEEAPITLFGIMDIEQELGTLLRRKVDLVEKEALRNPIRKKIILETREVVYAA